MLTQPWCSKNHIIISQGAQEEVNSLAIFTDGKGLMSNQAGLDLPNVNDPKHSGDGKLRTRQVVHDSKSAGDEALQRKFSRHDPSSRSKRAIPTCGGRPSSSAKYVLGVGVYRAEMVGSRRAADASDGDGGEGGVGEGKRQQRRRTNGGRDGGQVTCSAFERGLSETLAVTVFAVRTAMSIFSAH